MANRTMGKGILALVAVGLMTVSQIGCRACGTCHDYSSPVSGASYGSQCGSCSGGRAGSCCGADPVASDTIFDGGVLIDQTPTVAPIVH